jgi:hypothetical protein
VNAVGEQLSGDVCGEAPDAKLAGFASAYEFAQTL